MVATPQTNATLREIAEALCAHERFCVCGHINPDGDCIGSELALACALRDLGKSVVCLLAQHEPIDENLLFLPGATELVYGDECDTAPEVFVSVDVPNLERIGSAARVKERAALSITIDHHASDDVMSDLNYVDPDTASTTLLIWELIPLLETPFTADIATCCYTGLMTDTGRFQFQNTTYSSFVSAAEMVRFGADVSDISRRIYQNRRLASLRLEGLLIDRMRLIGNGAVALSWILKADMEALDARKSDVEPLIDALRSLAGVHVACTLRENDGEVRGSLRAKDDTDVSVIAGEFGGGGHKAAAGFTIIGTMDDAIRKVSARLEELFPEEEKSGAGLSS